MPKAVKRAGSWRCQVYDGKDENGKRIYKSITAKTKREAETAAALWIADREHRREEEEKAKARASIPTLDEVMSRYIATCEAQDYSPATIEGYQKIRRASFTSLVDKKIDEITAAGIQLALDERAAGRSPKTLRNDFAFIHAVLKRYRPDLNLSGTILAKTKKKPKRVFKQKWAQDILKYIRSNCPTDFYLYALFIISTGCRPSEIYSLTWSDISATPITRLDSDGARYKVGTIQIDSACVRGDDGKYHEKGPKTEAGNRTLTIDWSFFEELYDQRQRGADDARIIESTTRIIPYQWSKVRKALELPDTMRFYDLRHYYATQMSSAGASDEDLAASMGHSTPVMTHNVYIELFEEDQHRVSRAMATATADLFQSLNQDEKKLSTGTEK